MHLLTQRAKRGAELPAESKYACGVISRLPPQVNRSSQRSGVNGQGLDACAGCHEIGTRCPAQSERCQDFELRGLPSALCLRTSASCPVFSSLWPSRTRGKGAVMIRLSPLTPQPRPASSSSRQVFASLGAVGAVYVSFPEEPTLRECRYTSREPSCRPNRPRPAHAAEAGCRGTSLRLAQHGGTRRGGTRKLRLLIANQAVVDSEERQL